MPAHSNGSGPDVSERSTLVMGAGPGGLCSAYVLSKAGVPDDRGRKGAVRRRPGAHDPPADRIRRVQVRHRRSPLVHQERRAQRHLPRGDRARSCSGSIASAASTSTASTSITRSRSRNALKAIGPVAGGEGDGRLRPDPRRAASCSPRRSSRWRTRTSTSSGATLYELFFQRYSEKVWGLPCDQMSGDWVSQRSKGMSLVTAVKDAIVPVQGQGRRA